MSMEIIRLPAGEKAPHDADCVSIFSRPDGRFEINATALLACGDTDAADSVSMIGSDPYATFEEAEAAGLAWAADHCAGTVYVSTMPVGAEED